MSKIDPKRILYDDPHLLAVHKLPAELVVKGKGRVDRLPLLDFLKKQYPGLHPLHRLDFETSGVVVFARNRAVLRTVIESKFAGWKKTYLALVFGCPKPMEGEIRRALPLRSGKGMVETKTAYRMKETFKGVSLVEAMIERGQHHQIRKHFASIGHPLILDALYGDAKRNRAFTKALRYRRFFLHASSVVFPHPVTGAAIVIEAEMPKTFQDILERLRRATG